MEMPPDDWECVGFMRRFVAYLIDAVLITAVIAPLGYMIYGAAYFDLPEPGDPTVRGLADALLTFVLPPLAILLFWVYRAATPGKMAVGARIVLAADGSHPSVGRFVGRYLAYFVSAIPLGLGFLWIAFDRRRQGWHDKLAGTLVVRHRPSRMP
jgi:uncharacterized RDD family membrane protein YckC